MKNMYANFSNHFLEYIKIKNISQIDKKELTDFST